MDGPQLTSEQRASITARDVSVALSAGAGCGKTFVLTERFLSYLEPGSPVHLTDLAAITFTERAAREMRDRIRRRCQERLADAATDEEARHWLAISRELESARISTIHGFCASLLRAHAVEAGVDPRFRTLDAAEAETLLAETIDDALRRLLARRDEPTMDLIVKFGLGELKKMLRVLIGQRDKIDFRQWAARSPDDLLERWTAYHRDVVRAGVLRDLAEGTAAAPLLALLADNVPTNAVMQGRRASLLDRLPKLPHSGSPESDLDHLREQARVQGGGSARAWPDAEVYEQIKDLLSDLRGEIDGAQRLLRFDSQGARAAAESGLQLLAVTGSVVEAYAARKQELSVLDFDDLLIRARDLLAGDGHGPAALRARLGQQIHALLVDEFQDTDPLQVELVKALCGDALPCGKLFFVGDYKQSIYRFRRADPQVFRRLQEEIPAAGRLPLTVNFRSQPQILAFVNALFCEELGTAQGVPGAKRSAAPDEEPTDVASTVPYRTRRSAWGFADAQPQAPATDAQPQAPVRAAATSYYEPLRASRLQVAQPPAVEFLWAPAEDPEEPTPELRRREAQWIARRLRELLDAPARIVWDGDAAQRGQPACRDVQSGDVAILFRALSDVQFYEESLRRHGIDYYLVGGHAFYAQQEIFDVLNLLRAIAYPSDLVSLVGVLRSPFFALADETLYWLAKDRGGIGAGLFAPPPQVDAEQRPRVELAAATLGRLRACKDRLPITALVDDALRTTGYDAILLAEFMGERKLANLRKLIDQARTFDRSGIFTLGDFIRQLSEFVAKQPDEPLAATMPESAGVVRLMTIHQAKGLEFPVVVLPDLRRPMNSIPPPAAFDPELGPLVRSPDEDRRQHVLTGYDFLRRIEAREDEAELMRLFYVATTRAADYLILSSGVSAPGEADSPWLRLLAKRFDLLTGACVAELPRGFEQPLVRVTTSEPPLREQARRHRRPNLETVIAQAESLAAKAGPPPASIRPIAVDASARREFSFSRLNGALHAAPAVSMDDTEDWVAGAKRSAAPGEPPTNVVSATRYRSGRIGWGFADAQPQPPGRPAIDPIALGTLVHAVLEEVPLSRPAASAAEIDALIARHAPDHVPDDAAAAAEARDLVARFIQSPLAAELAASPEVHRETEFLLAWPPDRATASGVYFRGYIDCLFRGADGRWRLLDYKTNAVTAAGVAQAAAGYEMQMLVYALAVEAALGQAPEQMLLYFLRPGVAHVLHLDSPARRRAAKLVNEAIEHYLQTQITAEASRVGGPPPRPSGGPPHGHFRKRRQGLLPGFKTD